MNTNQIDPITQRLDRLERENRWWKGIGIASVALLGLVVLTGATKSEVADEVRARRFTLVDEKGKWRGGLSVNGENSSLNMRDSSGRVRLSLGASQDSSEFSLMDKDSEITAQLMVVKGISTLMLGDETPTGTYRGINLIVPPFGGAQVVLYNNFQQIVLDMGGLLGVEAKMAIRKGDKVIWSAP